MTSSNWRISFAWAVAVLAAAWSASSRADTGPPACGGASGLLAVVDRPTIGDSSCVVPRGGVVIEAGAAAGSLFGPPGGRFESLPNLEMRLGVPGNSELVWLPPSFQYQSLQLAPGNSGATVRGFGPTSVGLKHLVGYTNAWQWTVEALATLPSGDSTFGSHGPGGAVNAIVSYGRGSFGASLMAGATSQTESTTAGGQRFQSFNPDLVLTWQSSSRLQFYGEIYGQSHSGYQQGWGADVDAGVQYLLRPRLEVDLEEGARVCGTLGGFSTYTGAGLAVLL